MSENGYLEDLAGYLAALPDGERSDIISYYREYIVDAGLTDRAAIERHLGSARHLARVTLADASLKAEEHVDDDGGVSVAPRQRDWRNVWVIMLGVFALPIGVPVLIALALLMLAAVLTVGALILAVVAIGVSFIIAGISSVFAGLTVLTSAWPTGVFFVGCGLALVGLMLIIMPSGVWLVQWFSGWIAGMVRSVYRHLSERYHRGGTK